MLLLSTVCASCKLEHAQERTFVQPASRDEASKFFYVAQLSGARHCHPAVAERVLRRQREGCEQHRTEAPNCHADTRAAVNEPAPPEPYVFCTPSLVYHENAVLKAPKGCQAFAGPSH